MLGDDFMLALCMFREARSNGREGMQAVGCTIRNRVKINSDSSYYREVVRPLQFSSVTAHGDPQLGFYPWPANPVDWSAWTTAVDLAQGIIAGTVPDVTNGATHYFATYIPMPSWAENMTQTAQIGGQRFLNRDYLLPVPGSGSV